MARIYTLAERTGGRQGGMVEVHLASEDDKVKAAKTASEQAISHSEKAGQLEEKIRKSQDSMSPKEKKTAYSSLKKAHQIAQASHVAAAIAGKEAGIKNDHQSQADKHAEHAEKAAKAAKAASKPGGNGGHGGNQYGPY